MTKQEHKKAIKRAESLMDKEELECGLNSEFEAELQDLIQQINEYEKDWDK